MNDARGMPINFRVGARTLWSLKRRLVPHALSLDDALAGRLPPLAVDPGVDGAVILSVPIARLPALRAAAAGMLVRERQRYDRYFIDLTLGFDAWWRGLSGNTRSGLKRKAAKLAAASGGTLDVRRYRGVDALERFHALARTVSATTYQEKLLDAGLPDDAAFRRDMLADAAADTVRAWLLFVGDRAAAYLYCPIRGGTAVYDYLGHDPRFAALSPGSVLQLEALRDLFADGRLRHFDFTEGEGQHKRGLATGGLACADVLVLRATTANRIALAALAAFDRGVALAKAAIARAGLGRLAKRLRRG